MKSLSRFSGLFAAALLCCVPAVSPAQVSIGVAITVPTAPPSLPMYDQPPCPEEGYLWQPGYWAWGPDGYYWVPGVWVEPPEVGLLWTPGYWGYDGGRYGWHDGYWGETVGFYGGVDYGFGYTGLGFVGGMWAGSVFRYNTAVVNVNRTVVHTTYVDRSVMRSERMSRASFNGPGGVTARPTARQEEAMHQRHYEATAAQREHQTAASRDPGARFTANHGRPATVAMARTGANRETARTEPAHGAPRTETRAETRTESRPAAPARTESARTAEHERSVTAPRTENGRSSEKSAATARTGREATTARAENTHERTATAAHTETARPAAHPAERSSTARTENRPVANRERQSTTAHTEASRPAEHQRPATTAHAEVPRRPGTESRPASVARPAEHARTTENTRPAAESRPAPTPRPEEHAAPAPSHEKPHR